ncbi:TetR/AcrR family transcriptional regulator [Corticibacterium sp. UT-5YL-CI-8]|nr:TetR/AcrR family transcriptional regulator [Tianweitania sp. UT-5YL-CI-8]
MTDTPIIPPHKSKGRPRTFDRDAALISALGVFWRRGYEPASISELCAAMEINPPSLYAAFGNKAQLFMEAVNHYETTYWDATWERMAEVPDVHEALRGFFHEAAQILTSQDAPCGCLVILAATNVSAEAEEVNASLKAFRDEGREWLTRRVRRGISEGQIAGDTDPAGLGLTLNTLLEGMSLAARDGATREELETIAASVQRLLPANA